MYGEVEDTGVDQSILKWIFNKLDGNVDCIDPSHHRNKWQGSCERFCLVLRFRNKWRYTSTPTPSWSWINKLNIFTSQKTRVPIIKPDRLKLIIQKFVLNPEIHFVREKQRFRDVPPNGTWSVGNISVTLHRLREFSLPPQGERELRSSGVLRSTDW